MKKSVVYETAIVAVIDSDLEAEIMIPVLAELFDERSAALFTEKQEAKNAAS